MANPLKTLTARLRQYLQKWLGQKNNREEEPSQGELPDAMEPPGAIESPDAAEPPEDRELSRTFSGALPERASPAEKPKAEFPRPEGGDAGDGQGERPARRGESPEEIVGRPLASESQEEVEPPSPRKQPEGEPRQAEPPMPTVQESGKEPVENRPAVRGPESSSETTQQKDASSVAAEAAGSAEIQQDGGWDEVAEVIDSLPEPSSFREDQKRPSVPLHERQARIQERQQAKSRARRARLGRPPRQPSAVLKLEDTEDLLAPESGAPTREGQDEGPSVQPAKKDRGSVFFPVATSGRGTPEGVVFPDKRSQQAPQGEKQPADAEPRSVPPQADDAKAGSQQGITNRQATEIITFLREIVQNTRGTQEATEGVRGALEDLADKISTLGTMTE